jgi:serine/threonine protein kinase
VSARKARKYGRWEVTRDLDQGGQGWAYLVVEEGLADAGERVLKRLKNSNRINRFRREIEAGLRLSHPNIVRVIDSSPDTNPAYLVTEYCTRGALSPGAVTGKTLADRLAMFRSICLGVAHAHTQGVVHRDLKPDNIFLQADGTPMVGDGCDRRFGHQLRTGVHYLVVTTWRSR